MSMLDRVFLGSGGPLLPALAGWVIDQHVEGSSADCSTHVVVLPTGRARRRLEQLLLEAASERQVRLIPPELTTPSGLMSHFLVPDLASADALTSQLAWLQEIKNASQDHLKSITGHSNPLTDRESAALAVRLQKLMHELGAGGYTPAEAMKQSLKAGLPLEEQRWLALESLWSATNESLRKIERIDPNAARREALDANRVFTGVATKISIVSADPSLLLARLLSALDDQGIQINTIIHGEKESLEGLFDQFGGVDIDAWEERAIDLADHPVVTCDRVDDQIAVVLEHLADRTESDGEVEGGTTTVVVPDEELLPLMERHLHRQGVPVSPTTTRSLADGRIGRLLIILTNLLEDGRARHHGDLLRHPDVEQWMIQQGIQHPVARWDRLWNRHLPRRLDDLSEGSRAQHQFQELLSPLAELISPLQEDDRSACGWARSIMEIVGTLVASSDVPLGSQDSRALRIIRDCLEAQLDLYGAPTPDVTASDLMHLLVEQLRSGKTSRPDTDAIGLIGWLEAHLDDTPDLVITGLNENTIPAGSSTDPWLPEAVRELLSLSSQRRRTSRDAWLLSAILQSGRTVKLVTARRASAGDPLIPSRLLLRSSGRALAEQVLKLSGEEKDAREPELSKWRPLAESDSGFHEEPMPAGDPIIRHISVTAFKRYLSDPYNFMLERDERTRISAVETLDSLDHAGFGSLVHDVLEQWGREEHDRNQPTTDVELIEKQLIEALRIHALNRFGTKPIAPVRLQLAIAEQRLRSFAPHQAAHAAAGWRIHLVEASFGPRGYPEPLFPGQGGLLLRGKIDRVDQHDDHGFMAVDYKTGASVDSPEKAHRSKSNWKDLQLPLYRFLLESIDLHVSPAGLGYILLPPDALHTGFHLASWQEKDMAEAMEQAREIVEVITSGRLISLVAGDPA